MKRLQSKLLSPVVNQNGSGAIILSIIGISVAVLFFLIGIADLSRGFSVRVVQYESRQKLLDKTKSLIKNSAVVDYSIKNFNTPTQNDNLYQCILAGNPAGDAFCNKAAVNFYVPTPTGGERFLGGVDNPLYINNEGSACNADTQKCSFRAVGKCSFVCPGGQTQCATIKVMNCDLEISSLNGLIFKTMVFSQKYNTYMASYSVRLNDTMSGYVIVKQ